MKVLVTGGGGFLGLAIVKELLARDHEVTALSRSSHAPVTDLGVRSCSADLADARALQDVLDERVSFDAVVHTAAKTGIWGDRAEYERTNVDGTHNILEACVRSGVRKLVYTSSPSVCFDGRDHTNASNTLPYPSRYLAAYPETKARGEQLALAANGRGALATCALRPHLIFGPGDPHLIPRLIQRARAGRLAVIGDGNNEVSLTYVDNAAAAHIDALEALEPDAPHAGNAYFIGQQEHVRLWDWIADLFRRLDVPAVTRRVPRRLAYAGGALCELAWNALKLAGEPPMTRFVAQQLATDHSYDLGPAKRDFGYVERVPLAEATTRVVDALTPAD